MIKRVQFGLLILGCGLIISQLSAETFRFKYKEDGMYRIKSSVEEEVFVNGVYQYSTEILNKIAYTVTKVEGGRGFIEAVFQTSERAVGRDDLYQLETDYESHFSRDELGRYDIADKYYMPVVRHVPTFPEGNIEPGHTWIAEGAEVHDFREGMGIKEAYHFPIRVNYEYLGLVEAGDAVYHKIDIQYEILHRPEPVDSTKGMYPIQISGYSFQTLYWDNENGHAYRYDEEFDFQFFLNTGFSYRFRGFAEAEMIESPIMDRETIADEIEKELADQGVEDTDVRVVEGGVMISLENIQFLPDSDILISTEKEKLNSIAAILKRFPARDLMIVGHTALAGTEEGRQILSEQRAVSVGMYLMSVDAVSADRVIIRGKGALEPVADNRTEEGMRKNRRVEITILEN